MGCGASTEKAEKAPPTDADKKALPCASQGNTSEQPKADTNRANKPPAAEAAVYSGPICYLTSTGFVTDSQWANFVKVMLSRRGVLEPSDAVDGAKGRAELVAKYSAELAKLKVLYINDASYHRPTENMAKGRAGTGKVGDNNQLGRGEGTWFWWDQGLEDLMGVKAENINMIQLFEKPWLFNRPAREANHHASQPDVAELEAADETAYFEALAHTQKAYDALKEDPPQVGAGTAGAGLPGCPASGKNCADELAEISQQLNKKYAAALDKWCTEQIDGADLIVGQGGEVVMLNLAWQCNQTVANRLVAAVRSNRCVYAGLSASTMVCAKSMEMTGEIQPGWIEAFATDAKFLSQKQFNAKDLNGEGVEANVLGALPLIEAPMALRPHYSESWEAQVLEKNLLAEKEFERESGIDVCDKLVASSNDGCEGGCRLLTLISKGSKAQDHPVFVPIRNGKVIEVKISGREGHVVETFHTVA